MNPDSAVDRDPLLRKIAATFARFFHVSCRLIFLSFRDYLDETRAIIEIRSLLLVSLFEDYSFDDEGTQEIRINVASWK